MEQFKEIVLQAPEGMHYTAIPEENGRLIVRLVPNETVEVGADKAKFFTKITAEDREKVKNWLAKQNGITEQEKSFLTRVRVAVEAVKYDYWIANLEPSVANGKIYYAEGNHVGVGFSCSQWEQMAEEYSPENSSRLSNLHELLIWYALRIASGLWTLSGIANDSSESGNYRNALGATHSMEKTGARECGGYRDGQGNSSKIVTREGSYALVGGSYFSSGDRYPVAYVFYCYFPNCIRNRSSGVLVLLK